MMRFVTVFSAMALLLLPPTVSASYYAQRAAGVAGIPVEGHEVVAVFEVTGSKHFTLKLAEHRLAVEGARVRLGRPIDTGTICRLREVVRDVMAEKGYPNAEVTHDLVSLPNRGAKAVRLTVNIVEGRRSPTDRGQTKLPLSISERCNR